MRRRRTRANGDEGFVLVFMGIMLVALMLFAAFAVDVGFFYSRANKLQRAADAAALAGVVYMPSDFTKATAAAQDAASLNGFVDGVNGIHVDVARVIGSPRQLQVTIRDDHVPTFFGRVARDSIDMTRSAKGEYVGSIPMGSAYNALGTGTLTDHVPGDPTLKQNFWLSVNGFCSAKEDGDRILSKFDGNKKDSPVGGDARCDQGNSNVVLNADYNASGYDYVVDIPCTRADPSTPCDPTVPFAGAGVYIEVYNPVFDVDGALSGNPLYGDSRTLQSPATGAAQAQQDNWRNAQVTTTFSIDAPEVSDPENNNTTGATETHSYGTCHSGAGVEDGSVDPYFNTTSPTCNASDLGWVQLNASPILFAGRYKVHVSTTANEPYSYGMNTFALRVRVGPTFAACDARTAGNCPSVAGNSTMSVYANQPGTDAEFFLARLAPANEFAGKQVRVRLWDAGEQMSEIAIRDQNGNLALDTGAGKLISSVKVIDPGEVGPGCTESTALSLSGGWLDVSGNATSTTCGGQRYNSSKFNAKMVEFVITIPNNYDLGTTGGWWKIDYKASSGSGAKVQDRTTWEVRLVGDPVHLRRDDD